MQVKGAANQQFQIPCSKIPNACSNAGKKIGFNRYLLRSLEMGAVTISQNIIAFVPGTCFTTV